MTDIILQSQHEIEMRQKLAEVGIYNFVHFLDQVWQYQNLPKLTPVQVDIARFIESGPKHRGVQAFRGVGKSFITAGYALWRLLLNPNLRILIVSATATKADGITTQTKQLIELMPLLHHLEPRDRNTKWTNTEFTVEGATPDQNASVCGVGIDSQMTGKRADIIISDDIEIPKNSNTHFLREQLREKKKEFSAIRKPETDEMVILGTPQCEESIYHDFPTVEWKMWPVMVPENPEKYAALLGPRVQALLAAGAPAGTPVCTRFNRETIDEKRLEYGLAGFLLQFMMDTSLSDDAKYPLKLRNLIVCDLHEKVHPVNIQWGNLNSNKAYDLQEYSICMPGDALYYPSYVSKEHQEEYEQTGVFIDPSGDGADEMSYAVISFSHGMVYLRELGGVKRGLDDTSYEAIAALCYKFDAQVCQSEKNFGGGMFSKVLMPFMIRQYEGTGKQIPEVVEKFQSKQKELRIIDTLEPILMTHRLVVAKHIIINDYHRSQVLGDDRATYYTFQYQLTRIQKEKGALPQDDKLDVVAMGCQYYVDMMEENEKESEQRAKERALAEIEARFNQDEFGHGSAIQVY